MPSTDIPPDIEAWFAGRGWRIRDHQRAMLEASDRGDHALLVADTGAGKTLAGFLPTAEMYIVTTPQPVAQKVAQRAAYMAEKVRITVRGVIENMSWFTGDDGTRYELFGSGGGAELAEQLGVPERDVENMASRLSASDRSLNAPMAVDGDGEWQDLLPDAAPIPEQQVMESRDSTRRKEWIANALKALNPRETHIIMQRRLCEDSVTLETLGHELGISKERVRQIEHQALGKLRRALERIVGDPDESGLLPGT